ncbi:MAG: SRPBCC domain-containing protein [Leptospiraceae bacterium]|nr:SRPBCC domain-containing protein [Leptospiraceae bacterium]
MNSIQTEIIINAPKKIIWDILTDFPSYPEWNPFLIQVIGEASPGSPVFFIAKSGFIFIPILANILEFENGSKFSWGGPGIEWAKGLISAEHFFKIEEISERECIFHNNETMDGIIADTIWPLIQNTELSYVEMNYALKKRAEISLV